MKTYIFSFLTVALLIALIGQSDVHAAKNFDLINPPKKLDKNSLDLCSPKAPTTPKIEPFNKNSHDLKLNILWRTSPINDGQTWYFDPDRAVYWRYLRTGENPLDVRSVGVYLQPQTRNAPISSGNC